MLRISVVPIVLLAMLLATPLGTRLALAGIHGYQHTLSPLVGRVGIRCRFTPTCSRYAEVVIARDGLVRGGWKTAQRIARCGPWTPRGTVDEP
ncbi:MAG: membrane protein insertion efficiency factor YidD [Vicinamibacterales bacterium]